MATARLMQVWIDQDCCTGAGRCIDHCPELFVILEDGIAYVRSGFAGDGMTPDSAASVPRRSEQRAIDAAVSCPGECIYLEDEGRL